VQISQIIPLERATQLPVIGEAWVFEWYTPIIARFFDIPAAQVGVCHVNSSVVDSGSRRVRVHAEASADYRKRVASNKVRKVKRARQPT